uniref:Uncharacterized protein n=1 Tax=Moniliophthora roreri TaxID=221103 RepID=A0A0W0G2K4_MONRR
MALLKEMHPGEIQTNPTRAGSAIYKSIFQERRDSRGESASRVVIEDLKLKLKELELVKNQTLPLPAPPQKAVIDVIVIDLSGDEPELAEATPQTISTDVHKRATNSSNKPNSRMEALPLTIAINS